MVSSLTPQPTLQRVIFTIMLGVVIGFVNLFVTAEFIHDIISPSEPESVSIFIAVFLSGGIAGAIQGLFLRPFARPAVAWLIASSVGWMGAYGISEYFYTHTVTSMISPTSSELALGLLLGFVVGTAQWLVLRQRWPNAHLWIVSTVFVWSISWFAMTLFSYAIMGPAL